MSSRTAFVDVARLVTVRTYGGATLAAVLQTIDYVNIVGGVPTGVKNPPVDAGTRAALLWLETNYAGAAEPTGHSVNYSRTRSHVDAI